MDAPATSGPLQELVREHAALRRVATLVARAPSPTEVFAAVTEEAGVLLGASRASLLRVDGPGWARVVAGWSDGSAPPIPVGHRAPIDGRGILGLMLKTRQPVRIDDFDAVGEGVVSTLMRELGIRSGVGGPIILGDRVWGALNGAWPSGAPPPAGAEERIAAFAQLVAYAIENAETRDELAASRARIVEAADAARRRIERDLHDGAQQRFVATALELARLERGLARDPSGAASALARAREQLDAGLSELRDLARGIHPAVLTDRGLEAALIALARQAPLPVDLDLRLPRPLDEAIEAAAYFLVSEALTNVAKHAQASSARVEAAITADSLMVTIADDGIGGANPPGGSGLQGLIDRVTAVGGKLEIDSVAKRGTTLRALLPTTVLGPVDAEDR